MRTLTAPTLAQIQRREGLAAKVLIGIAARNRTTGATERMHLWTGRDHREFTVEGQIATYFGAGSILELPPLVRSAGLAVRMHRLVLSQLTPEVVQLVRGWDPRLGAVTMHRILLDPLTRQPVDATIGLAHRVFKGFVDGVKFEDAAEGGSSRCILMLATEARVLTRTLALKKSDESQRLRAPGDRFLRYADISGSVEVWWGEKRLPAESSPTPASGGRRLRGPLVPSGGR